MAGLNCQTPSLISFPVIRDTACYYGTLTDKAAQMGMRIFANSLGEDSEIISGESGVAGFAFVNMALQDEYMRDKLGLDSSSRILVINTEGDTDEKVYQKLIKGF